MQQCGQSPESHATHLRCSVAFRHSLPLDMHCACRALKEIEGMPRSAHLGKLTQGAPWVQTWVAAACSKPATLQVQVQHCSARKDSKRAECRGQMTLRQLGAAGTKALNRAQAMFARHPTPPCPHAALGSSGRFGTGLLAWLAAPGLAQQPQPRSFSVSASGRSSASSRAAGLLVGSERDAERQERSDLRTVPGIGKVNEQRLRRKGLTSVELLTEVFIERKKRNEAEMIAYLQARWLVCCTAEICNLLARHCCIT